jgi:hypothetical protein
MCAAVFAAERGNLYVVTVSVWWQGRLLSMVVLLALWLAPVSPTDVGEGGLEPPHPFGHRHLKPARLPIPPLAR